MAQHPAASKVAIGLYVNQEFFAEALGPMRSQVGVAPKFGFRIDDTNGLDTARRAFAAWSRYRSSA
jgi:hypothetical protein